jgi:hypothetical protein
MNRHGAYAELSAGAQDAQGDFATIGNQNFFEHEAIFGQFNQ